MVPATLDDGAVRPRAQGGSGFACSMRSMLACRCGHVSLFSIMVPVAADFAAVFESSDACYAFYFLAYLHRAWPLFFRFAATFWLEMAGITAGFPQHNHILRHAGLHAARAARLLTACSRVSLFIPQSSSSF